MVFESTKIGQKSVEFCRIILIIWLVLKEALTLIRKRECSKQERLNWERKVSILGLLAVFVHGIPDDSEVNWGHHLRAGTGLRLKDELVTFAVPVGEYNHHHAIDDLLLLDVSEQLS